ncbi:MAG: zinc ribbon domain-containing protein [Lentisphaerae bacterium]|jgi:putative FmdB family regulatory protein|nr:zinc ribbon domain-containing protein [Lentisphaerota bacterium]
MPIYEYRCQSCGHKFSHLHKRLNEPAPHCPKCQAEKVKKLLSSFSAGVSNKSDCAYSGQCPSAHSGGQNSCAGCCSHKH